MLKEGSCCSCGGTCSFERGNSIEVHTSRHLLLACLEMSVTPKWLEIIPMQYEHFFFLLDVAFRSIPEVRPTSCETPCMTSNDRMVVAA